MNKGKLGYVNSHFSVRNNNTRGSTYSKEYNDDDDGGTLIDRKLIKISKY